MPSAPAWPYALVPPGSVGYSVTSTQGNGLPSAPTTLPLTDLQGSHGRPELCGAVARRQAGRLGRRRWHGAAVGRQEGDREGPVERLHRLAAQPGLLVRRQAAAG